jgi:hypothetical protein
MKNLSFLLLLFSVATFAAAPKKFTNDVLQFGGGANGSLKDLIFNTGAGTNPSIRANSGDGSLLLRTNSATLGDGTASDKTWTFDIGQGANNPKFFWDNTAGALSFTNDGTLIKKIGSGSGGGGGENFNNAFLDDQNPNAEDGLTNWTNTGGTFTLNTSDPLEGEQSFEYTPSAQNNFVQGPLLNVDRDIFRGRACQARIEYIGGDNNLELRIVDLSGATFKNIPLPAHTIAAAEDVFFLCPTASDILVNANLAQLRLRIFNSGASASPLIKFDKVYLGTLIGLSETTTPDVFAARINGGGIVDGENVDFINGSCSNPSTGNYTCAYSPGVFGETPTVLISGKNDDRIVYITAENSTGFSYQIVNLSDVLINDSVSVNVTKSGADAKQSVQVYKSIPKVSENINSFSAKLECTGSSNHSRENTDWINNVTNNVNAICTINFNTGVFSQTPNCTFTSEENGQFFLSSPSASSVQIIGINDGGGNNLSYGGVLKCSKGDDFKLPTVQPILVNQVSTRAERGSEKGVCHITNTGSATFDSSDPDCWFIQSVARNSIGDITLTFVDSGFKCTLKALQVERISNFQQTGGGQIDTPSLLQTVKVITRISSSGGNDDTSFALACSKNKQF